jgi:hypothetical protein
VDCFLLLSDVAAHPGVFCRQPRILRIVLRVQGLETGGNAITSKSCVLMSDTHQSGAGTAATERYEALLRVSQTLISILSSEELFRLLARELRAVVNFYVMGVGIYDENAHQIHLTSYGEHGVPLKVPQFAPEPLMKARLPSEFCDRVLSRVWGVGQWSF